MDVLASVMRELHLSSAGYRRLELTEPWAIRFDQAGLRGVHVVLEGRCEALFEASAPLQLGPGDLVLAPRADPHVLRSPGASVAAVTPAHLADQGFSVRHGGGAAPTVILCGAFRFMDSNARTLAALPRVLHLPGEDGRARRWLSGYLEALVEEAADAGPGSEVVMARITAAILTRALRDAAGSDDATGWLRGLSDPAVGRALGLMHDGFDQPWTLAQLARACGMSRALFAARFQALVGEPPIRYLYRRRMEKAAQLLQDGGVSLSQVAAAVGYASDAAFSVAFKRYAGVAPGKFRTTGSTA